METALGVWPEGLDWCDDAQACAYLGFASAGDPSRIIRALEKHHRLRVAGRVGDQRRHMKADLDSWVRAGGTNGRPLYPRPPRDPSPTKRAA